MDMHGVRRTAQSFSRALARAFPMPALLAPSAAGIDISDASVKWLVLETSGDSHRVRSFGELPLVPGIVQNGIIHDVAALGGVLSQVRDGLRGVTYAHAALPEEAAYVFSMNVPPGADREQILRMVEFEFEGRVPIPPSAAVYDFSVIPHDAVGTDEIGVVVFPHEVAETYAEAFETAGIHLLSLEVEASSIARAISSGSVDEPITLVADFGRARTGFAVLKRGIPIFTSTVEVGGDSVTKALSESLKMSPEEVERFKNESGLVAVDGAKSPQLEAISGPASAFADEVARHYHYWDTRRNDRGDRMTPVGQVVLVGGNTNLRGLPDYIASRVQAKVFRGNVWRHVASFDDYIPPIDRRISLQYVTAIGLALRGI